MQPHYKACVYSTIRNVLVFDDNSQEIPMVHIMKRFLHCVNGVYKEATHKRPWGSMRKLCMGCCLLCVCLKSVCVSYQENYIHELILLHMWSWIGNWYKIKLGSMLLCTTIDDGMTLHATNSNIIQFKVIDLINIQLSSYSIELN